MSKLSRHKAILELLDEGPVSNQEELQRLLRKRGFDARCDRLFRPGAYAHSAASSKRRQTSIAASIGRLRQRKWTREPRRYISCALGQRKVSARSALLAFAEAERR